jgi:hypothetical protein
MKLIHDADLLLKEISKTREPIEGMENIDNEEVAKAMAKVIAPEPRKRWFSMWYFLFIPVLIMIQNKFHPFRDDNARKYTYKEAKSYCAKQGKLLPLSIADIEASGYKVNNHTAVWAEDGDIIFGNNGKVGTDSTTNNVVCVNVNGKDDFTSILSNH